MSITVDYFFNFSGDLTDLVKLIKENIGCSLVPYQGDLFSRFLGMELSLSKHIFENDGELNYEDYAFLLSLRTPMGLAALRSLQVPAMAYMAYVLYWGCRIKGMLVYDGQILLARYEKRLDEIAGAALYDTVSNEFINFPFHLDSLGKRLPER
jgi:hypothetical protein